jgi:hypothetical protein
MGRRAVLAAGAWTLPVVALAAATPSAAASGGATSFVALDTMITAQPDVLVFPLAMMNVPALPVAEEGDYVGLSVVLCLPDGVQVLGASSVDGVTWAYSEGSEGFSGGEVFVFNTSPIDAGYDGTLLIRIEQAPDAGLHGALGADVVPGSTGDLFEVEWEYAYPDAAGPALPNCAAA